MEVASPNALKGTGGYAIEDEDDDLQSMYASI
jgi:hypothetical protein